MQIVGGCVGAVLAHLMFGLDLVQIGSTARTGVGQWAGEFIATFGLIATILGCVRFKPDAVATAVGLYITSAYWFTASTSFANPAVTIARSLSDTFAGIAPATCRALFWPSCLARSPPPICSAGCSPSLHPAGRNRKEPSQKTGLLHWRLVLQAGVIAPPPIGTAGGDGLTP